MVEGGNVVNRRVFEMAPYPGWGQEGLLRAGSGREEGSYMSVGTLPSFSFLILILHAGIVPRIS